MRHYCLRPPMDKQTWSFQQAYLDVQSYFHPAARMVCMVGCEDSDQDNKARCWDIRHNCFQLYDIR